MTHQDRLYEFLRQALEYVENKNNNSETGKKYNSKTGKKYRAAACFDLLCVLKGLTKEEILNKVRESNQKPTSDQKTAVKHLQEFFQQNPQQNHPTDIL